MGYVLHSTCIKNLETLRNSGNPLSEKLIIAVKRFIDYTPIDFGIVASGGFRSSEDQNKLFKKVPKVTNCDGYIYKSVHQSGLAVDLVPYVDGDYSWDDRHATGLAMAFKTFCNLSDIEIVSGADWGNDGNLNESFYDPCHFEIKG